MLIYDLKKDLL